MGRVAVGTADAPCGAAHGNSVCEAGLAGVFRNVNQWRARRCVSGTARRQRRLQRGMPRYGCLRPLTADEAQAVGLSPTGAPLTEGSPGKVFPAPYPSSLRPPKQDAAGQPPCPPGKDARRARRRRLLVQNEIAPAPEGFLPPATGGLGCASPAWRCRQLPVSTPPTSLTDARAANSGIRKRSTDAVRTRQGSPCPARCKPKKQKDGCP